MDNSIITGFSKYSKQQRIEALIQKYHFDVDINPPLEVFTKPDFPAK